MQSLAFGCGPIPTRRKDYFNLHTALEVSETFTTLVSRDTLHAWRKEAGKAFTIVLVAHRYLSFDPDDALAPGPLGHAGNEHGFLRPTEANRALWAEVDAQARALHANMVELRTPASFTPTRQNIANLETFRKEIIGDVPYKVCWEARGLWDDEELAELSEKLDLLIVKDPYVPFTFDPPSGGDVVYTLKQPRGRRNFDREDAIDLLDYFEEHEGNVLAIFRGGERERNAYVLAAEMRRRYDNITGPSEDS